MSSRLRPSSALEDTFALGVYRVGRVGYGAMQLRRFADNPGEAMAVLRRAIELGVDHIDTAHFYGAGFVNDAIRNILKPGDEIVVASKIGADPDPSGKHPIRLAQRPEQLRASVEDNLASLGVEQIPLVYLRRTDVGPGLVAEGDQVVDLDDQMAVLVSLRDEGKIGALGLSSVDLKTFTRARAAGVVAVQNAYSVLSRETEDVLAACLAEGVAWVPFFPLGGAMPGALKVTDQPRVLDIAAQMKVTPSQVGLAWMLQHAANTLLIPGTASVRHLEENMAVPSIQLDEIAMAQLDALAPRAQAGERDRDA